MLANLRLHKKFLSKSLEEKKTDLMNPPAVNSVASKQCRHSKKSQSFKKVSIDGIPDDWFEVSWVYCPKEGKDLIQYTCKFGGCNKTFRKLCNIRCHFRLHDSRKPFECHICLKQFTQYGNLKKHYQSTHPGGEMRLTMKKLSHCDNQS